MCIDGVIVHGIKSGQYIKDTSYPNLTIPIPNSLHQQENLLEIDEFYTYILVPIPVCVPKLNLEFFAWVEKGNWNDIEKIPISILYSWACMYLEAKK